MPENFEGSPTTAVLDKTQENRTTFADQMGEYQNRFNQIEQDSKAARTSSILVPPSAPRSENAIAEAADRIRAAAKLHEAQQDARDDRRFTEFVGETAGLFAGITSVSRTEPIQVRSSVALPTVASASPDHVAAVEEYVARVDTVPLSQSAPETPDGEVTLESPREPVTKLEPEPFRTEGGRHMTEAQNNTLPSYLTEPSAFRPTSEERKAAEDLVDQFAPGPVSKTFFDPGEKGPGTQLGRKLFSFSERISNAFSSLKNRLTPKRMPPPKPA